jgi:hypothetical protein
MYSDLDEMPTHQIVAPHSKVVVDNPAWTDRYYFSTFNTDGSLILEMGIGAFPNTGVLEGFACASVRNGDFRTQYNLRPSRPLDGKLLPLEAGPLSFKVLEAQRRWRITLQNNPQGLSYDLELTWEGRPFEAVPIFLKDKQGNIVTHVCHYVQRGKTNGTVKIGDREYRMDNAIAFRDRSWGIRSTGEGGPKRGLLNWVPMAVGDDLILYYSLERQDGKFTYLSGARLSVTTGEEDVITDVRHDIQFEGTSKIFKSGKLNLSFESGRQLGVSMRKLGSLYLRGAGYYQGGHGIARSSLHVEGETWDISGTEQQQQVSTLNDNVCEFTFSDGKVGYGIYELAIGSYPRYGFQD